ncbi:MAG: DUF2461 domain-containing protein [Defluviimonas sp.]|nr:DUF2461 domain-containing protein [Paracoccaceae bacterium]MCC0064075.1 DUF2461 domain-containing protein [Defluviimonas sp.]
MALFAGFPQETFAFLDELAQNNRRSWFEANRARYERFWREPGLAFVEALGPGMAAMTPAMKAEPRLNGSLRRINRDTRFALDKTPYDPQLHLIFWPGAHPNRGAGFHFVLRADGIGYGAGRWAFEGDLLARYRARLADPAERDRLLAAIEAGRGIGCYLDEPHLKTVPKGHAGTPDWDFLLRYKGLVLRTMDGQMMPRWIEGPEAVDEVLDRCARLMPLVSWLDAL